MDEVINWLVGGFWRLSDVGQVAFMGAVMLITLVLGVVAGNALADAHFGKRPKDALDRIKDQSHDD